MTFLQVRYEEYTEGDWKAMNLVPFEPTDYETLIDWIPSKEFSLQWGSRIYQWPLTIEQIEKRQKVTDVESYLFVDKSQKIGFIEIRKISNEVYRLCRIIISENIESFNVKGEIFIK